MEFSHKEQDLDSWVENDPFQMNEEFMSEHEENLIHPHSSRQTLYHKHHLTFQMKRLFAFPVLSL